MDAYALRHLVSQIAECVIDEMTGMDKIAAQAMRVLNALREINSIPEIVARWKRQID